MKSEKIAEDLLNLYAEGLLNEESKEFVEENLSKSEELREKLRQIKEDKIDLENNNPMSLDFVAKRIKQDKKSYGLLITSLVVSILLIGFSFLTKPIHYEDDGNLYTVTNAGNQIFINFKKDLVKVDSYEEKDEDGQGKEIFLDAYTTRLDQILNKTSKQVLAFEKNSDTIYYNNQDKNATLIYGNVGNNVQILPRLALNFYFILICIGSGLLIILSLIVKKYRKFIKYIVFIPISYLLAYISICGLNFYSFYLERDFVYIVILWLSLYLLSFSIIKLIENKKNKAI